MNLLSYILVSVVIIKQFSIIVHQITSPQAGSERPICYTVFNVLAIMVDLQRPLTVVLICFLILKQNNIIDSYYLILIPFNIKFNI